MAQLRDIRRRIKSVQNTQQVTRAMKMVAAAKLRRAQERIVQARPYANHLQDMISAIVSSAELPPHALLKKNPGDHLHLIVITGDRGLCGSFNSNVFREVKRVADLHQGSYDLTMLGRKGVEHFRRRNYPMSHVEEAIDKKDPQSLARILAEEVSNKFVSGEYSQVALCYTEFKSAMTQKLITEQLLPMEFPPESGETTGKYLDYIFYPDAEQILAHLLPRYIHSQIFRAILESQASVFGARMSAMDMATRNSQEMISKLTLKYNRARQAAITTELIEVVSGANALDK